MAYRTDLAMERTVSLNGIEGLSVNTSHEGEMELTWVHVHSEKVSKQLGKSIGAYWTMIHPQLPFAEPDERIRIAQQIAQTLRLMLPPKGDVLVLGLGNRRMTADALGDRVVGGILVTRHLKESFHSGIRGVSALSPGVLGVTGIETAELARGLVDKLKPSALIVVDSLAAMETNHIGTTVQVTDTGIQPGSGVGNHRKGIDRETMSIPVIAIGIPLVVYASTIVRDSVGRMLNMEEDVKNADDLAEAISECSQADLVVTPKNIDELVAGLADMLALAINCALQPMYSVDELTHMLH